MSDSAAPLSPREFEDLLPSGLVTRAELEAWEKAAVLKGRRWALGRRRAVSRVLSESFVREVHRKMFGDTWRWAGNYRDTDLPGRVPAELIPLALQGVFADTASWIDEQTWSGREIGARFHPRLVAVYPFPHGNGRWSRLATDALLAAMREPLPTWGMRSGNSSPRSGYVEALRQADSGQFDALMLFMWG
jgi:Fic-DOC domain mobile mystery protein B